jgi:hypothetical protein
VRAAQASAAAHPASQTEPPLSKGIAALLEASGAAAVASLKWHFQLVYAPNDEPELISNVATAAGLLAFVLALISMTQAARPR